MVATVAPRFLGNSPAQKSVSDWVAAMRCNECSGQHHGSAGENDGAQAGPPGDQSHNKATEPKRHIQERCKPPRRTPHAEGGMKQGIAKADKARASRSRSKHSIYLECGKRLWSSMHSDPRYAIPLQDGTRFMRIVLSFA